MEQQLDDPVIQAVPLGAQWPTIDPFLFCVHHDDAYPAGNERLGPAASLAGRELGAGLRRASTAGACTTATSCPGFPQHPHRGFETVTFVRTRAHRPLRLARRRGALRARRRAVAHRRARASCTPRCSRCSTATGPNPLELFQIWLNLPAADKLVEPHFTMLWDDDIPRRRTSTTTAASPRSPSSPASSTAHAPPPPPPHSWAARARRRRRDLDDPHATPGATWTLPAGRRARHGAHALRLRRLRRRDRRARRSGADTGAVVRCDVAGRARRPATTASSPGAAGPADRRAGRAVRAVRDERPRRDRAGVRRLPAHRLRRLAVADRRPGARRATRGRFARHADGRVEQH